MELSLVMKMGKSLHILDLYRNSLLFKPHTPSTASDISATTLSGPYFQSPRIIRSATEMNEAGIRFRPSDGYNPRDIFFDEGGGILRLPLFVVNDATESTFLNLMAFERCHIVAGHDITSFICFMGAIIYHDRDINLLSSEYIILNTTGNDQAVVNLFRTMSKDLMIHPSSRLNIVSWRIDTYLRNRRNKWLAELVHTYFKNPWVTISVIAAIVLFILTTLQTVFTIYDVTHK